MKLRFYLSAFSIIMFGQLAAQTFEREYNFGLEEEISTLVELPNGKFIISIVDTDLKDNYFAYFENAKYLKTDSVGNILDSISIQNYLPSYHIYWNNSIYALGRRTVINQQNNLRLIHLALYRFDTNLNILGSTFYGDSLNMVFPSKEFMVDSNKLVLPISQVNMIQNDFHSRMLKFDSSLNLVSKKVYDSSRTVNFPEDIFLAPKKGKYVVLHNGRYGDTINYLKQGLSTMDKSKLQIDTSFYLEIGIQNPFTGPCNIYMQSFGERLPNNNLLVGGVTNWLDDISDDGSTKETMAVIFLDSNLNRINAHIFTAIDSADHPADYQAIAISKKYVYIGGNKNWDFNDSYKSETSSYRLVKMDFLGNIIFEKFYTNGTYLHLSSVQMSKDGGIVMAGSTYDSLNAFSDGLDAFILKVDSNGNRQTVGLGEREMIDSYDYSVYPNPASNQLNFQKFNYFMPYKVRLFDAFGREVMRFNWLEDQKSISIADMAPGVYVYRISDENGRMARGKVVVSD